MHRPFFTSQTAQAERGVKLDFSSLFSLFFSSPLPSLFLFPPVSQANSDGNLLKPRRLTWVSRKVAQVSRQASRLTSGNSASELPSLRSQTCSFYLACVELETEPQASTRLRVCLRACGMLRGFRACGGSSSPSLSLPSQQGSAKR